MKMFLRGRPVPMLIPDELAPTYSLDTRSELPSSRLRLDWVYPLIRLPLYPREERKSQGGTFWREGPGVGLQLEGEVGVSAGEGGRSQSRGDL